MRDMAKKFRYSLGCLAQTPFQTLKNRLQLQGALPVLWVSEVQEGMQGAEDAAFSYIDASLDKVRQAYQYIEQEISPDSDLIEILAYALQQDPNMNIGLELYPPAPRYTPASSSKITQVQWSFGDQEKTIQDPQMAELRENEYMAGEEKINAASAFQFVDWVWRYAQSIEESFDDDEMPKHVTFTAHGVDAVVTLHTDTDGSALEYKNKAEDTAHPIKRKYYKPTLTSSGRSIAEESVVQWSDRPDYEIIVTFDHNPHPDKIKNWEERQETFKAQVEACQEALFQ